MVWNNPTVHPDDRGFWQWLAEDEAEPLRRWVSEAAFHEGGGIFHSRLPTPNVFYDLVAGGMSGSLDGRYRDLVADLHRCTLQALRQVTDADGWVYGVDEPEAGFLYCYRFWPHLAPDDGRWYVSPVPDGDHQFLVSQDFDCGILASSAELRAGLGRASLHDRLLRAHELRKAGGRLVEPRGVVPGAENAERSRLPMELQVGAADEAVADKEG